MNDKAVKLVFSLRPVQSCVSRGFKFTSAWNRELQSLNNMRSFNIRSLDIGSLIDTQASHHVEALAIHCHHDSLHQVLPPSDAIQLHRLHILTRAPDWQMFLHLSAFPQLERLVIPFNVRFVTDEYNEALRHILIVSTLVHLRELAIMHRDNINLGRVTLTFTRLDSFLHNFALEKLGLQIHTGISVADIMIELLDLRFCYTEDIFAFHQLRLQDVNILLTATVIGSC